jgi:hypothetical protein
LDLLKREKITIISRDPAVYSILEEKGNKAVFPLGNPLGVDETRDDCMVSILGHREVDCLPRHDGGSIIINERRKQLARCPR